MNLFSTIYSIYAIYCVKKKQLYFTKDDIFKKLCDENKLNQIGSKTCVIISSQYDYFSFFSL